MLTLGPLGFAAPAMLWALAALPVLWWLLRAVPPAPVRRRFAGVALLLGLRDDTQEAHRTPWWLLALRMAAMAAAIIGFAGPVLAPEPRAPGAGPLLVVLDGGWPDARDWAARIAWVDDTLARAGEDGRPVAVVSLAAPPPAGGLEISTAAEARARLAGLLPQPWLPGPAAGAWSAALPSDARFETLWLTGGLDWPGRSDTLAALSARGGLRVIDSPTPLRALTPPAFEDGAIVLGLRTLPLAVDTEVEIIARGPDPAGTERDLWRTSLIVPAQDMQAKVRLDAPTEVRNRIDRFEITSARTAGAVALVDDSLRRRKVVLISSQEARDEGMQLLSPLHYLRNALAPSADLIEGAGLTEAVLTGPDVVILADVARLPPTEAEALEGWVRKGGLLVRFAGPRLAASDVARTIEDPLMPVRLREGGRTLGGAMSWGAPRTLAPFSATSPFAGLSLPDDVVITAQVLAQPDPELGTRSIAALEDGTPLVTRRAVGLGQVVLFHVTANAEWSSLPLSGLFVQMLERLAISARTAPPEPAEMAGQTWQPVRVLDGFGRAGDAARMPGAAGALLADALARGLPGPGLPPGIYAAGDRRVALNALGPDTVLTPPLWPADVAVLGMDRQPEQDLKGPLLVAALILLLADTLVALSLAGRLGKGLWPPGRLGAARARRGAAILALGVVLASATPAPVARAQSYDADGFGLRATSEVVLAHVITGDARTDDVAAAGLRGLGRILAARTSIEPGAPIGVDLERDELAFFPLLYWPVGPETPLPSAEAYGKIARYLRLGGMVVFDTRDADRQAGGIITPAQARLRLIAAPLDIPPLEPVPEDHVLTRTFYLLSEFPGRLAGPPPWVEAAPPDASQEDGAPFRILNDGVTPVLVGANDWAGAWAVDAMDAPLLPVGRGFAGERQREMAYRFGINLVMHVLTGNYKSDQVHVPALLDRLGQ